MPPTGAATTSSFGRKIRLIVVLTIAVQMVRWVMGMPPAAIPPAADTETISISAVGKRPASPIVQQEAADPGWRVMEGGIGPVSFGMAVDTARRFFGPSFVAPADTSGRGCGRAFGPMLP